MSSPPTVHYLNILGIFHNFVKAFCTYNSRRTFSLPESFDLRSLRISENSTLSHASGNTSAALDPGITLDLLLPGLRGIKVFAKLAADSRRESRRLMMQKARL